MERGLNNNLQPNMPDKIIVYGHAMCPGVPPVLAMLKRVKADYEYINIHQDDAARLQVQAINGGYESVPTLVFPGGATLTEPSAGDLAAELQRMGYQVSVSARLAGNMWWLVIGFGVLLALLRTLGVF